MPLGHLRVLARFFFFFSASVGWFGQLVGQFPFVSHLSLSLSLSLSPPLCMFCVQGGTLAMEVKCRKESITTYLPTGLRPRLQNGPAPNMERGGNSE